MAIGFVGTISGRAINGGTPAISYPGTYRASDVAIVTVAIGSSIAVTLGVTSSSGATTFYTQIVPTIRTSLVSFGVFRRVIASVAETAINITGGGALNLTSVTGVVHIFRGVNTTTPEITSTSTTGGSTDADPPSVTPTKVGCATVISMGRGTSISALLTSPSGSLNFQSTTASDTDPATVGQAWFENNSTQTLSPAAFVSTVTGTWAAATIALNPLGLTSADGDPWREMGLTSADGLVKEERLTVIRSY